LSVAIASEPLNASGALCGPADMSENGLAQSYGAMINYLCEPAQTEERHEAFVNGGVIAIDAGLQRNLKEIAVKVA
jgi:hypothetical protein